MVSADGLKQRVDGASSFRDAHHGANMTPTANIPDTRVTRRSERCAAANSTSNPRSAAATRPEIQEAATVDVVGEPRRNPKRKASEAESRRYNLPEDLLGHALKSLTPNEVQEWEGWAEVESEPAFFNTILHDLGVKDINVQELFSIDRDYMDWLPKPVHGLIFLYQYAPDHEEPEVEPATNTVWFANQTTHNACATIALLNIIMNITSVDIGHQLRSFKESTKALPTPLRGLRISTDRFIRFAHNSFTRRMDHLNCDLALDNEASVANKKGKKKHATKKGRAQARKDRKSKTDYAFHFIAYVPVGDAVWELDGLRTHPRELGLIPQSKDWTEVAQPHIEARMLQYEGSQSFNLLALCPTGSTTQARQIAEAACSLQFVRETMLSHADWANLISHEPSPLDLKDPAQLLEYDLVPSDLDQIEVPEGLRHKMRDPDLRLEDVYELHQQTIIKIKTAMAEYHNRSMAIAEAKQRVMSRKKDYGSALHMWIARLAEKGLLEEVLEVTQ